MGEARRKQTHRKVTWLGPGKKAQLGATVFISEHDLAMLQAGYPTDKVLYMYLGDAEHIAPNERQAFMTLEVPLT